MKTMFKTTSMDVILPEGMALQAKQKTTSSGTFNREFLWTGYPAVMEPTTGLLSPKLFFLLLLFLILFQQTNAAKDIAGNQWQFTVATGIRSFYAPVQNLKWESAGTGASAGINRLVGQKQLFSFGLQAHIARPSNHGNNTSLQLLGVFTPVLFKRLELGIGTGGGYRISDYLHDPVIWKGNKWERGKPYKGMLQIPLQFSLGYRTLDMVSFRVIPYASWQLQALFGYNPDFSPLPDSYLMIGFKFSFNNN